ncbi:MAG: hypothetical protein ABII06_04755 [Pseudomonadota bacterium]
MELVAWTLFGVTVGMIVAWFAWGWRLRKKEEREHKEWVAALRNKLADARKKGKGGEP